MRQLIAITKALADENRIRIVGCLRRGELCVCQIVELLQLAPSTVSKHLAILKQAGLIESRKKGRWIHCRLAAGDAPAVVQDALKFVLASTGREARAREDSRRLKAILRLEPEVLCENQRKRGGAGIEDESVCCGG